MKWNFSFDLQGTKRKYEELHKVSRHAPRIQMRKAPRKEYTVKNLDSIGKRIKFKMDPDLFEKSSGKSFVQVLKQRRTSWIFKGEDLGAEDFKEILLYSFGISEQDERKRTYPSGGQFYSIEVYILPTRRSVNSGLLEEKVYKFNVNSNEVVEMENIDLTYIDGISASTDVGFFSLEDAQFAVVLVGNDKDLAEKYMELSYRIMLLEAGHMAQNLLLTCTYKGISSVPLGGFHENQIKKLLHLPKEKMVFYTILGG
ncbi:SagB/ThcOx family dehydrogenase [Rossellomorea vietnamensis]|uniref:SagB/ThcOx family dehydrogenase n=1 Tax=Rossellomorea vietnamensis TaxID=218284 RepID=A0A5D4MAA7_9BACI|nr:MULTISPECIES: SagB/ThcOx family dehydrogenase [Bacillaceae]TYR98566.1 SagB/ThcOx family dehydrogenase [Rossellomorea vietnamensis]